MHGEAVVSPEEKQARKQREQTLMGIGAVVGLAGLVKLGIDFAGVVAERNRRRARAAEAPEAWTSQRLTNQAAGHGWVYHPPES